MDSELCRSVDRPIAPPMVCVTDPDGTTWRVYDRVRCTPAPTQAEFRYVAPGRLALRGRCFVSLAGVVLELHRDDHVWRDVSPFDLRPATLGAQLAAARRRGLVYVPGRMRA
jgi:hypothetical protein